MIVGLTVAPHLSVIWFYRTLKIYLSFFTKDKEGWTTPNILNLPCHSIAFGVSNTSITIGEYDHMVQSSPRLPYCLHTTIRRFRIPGTGVGMSMTCR